MSHWQSCLLVAAVVILLLNILCKLTILSYLLHQQRDCKRLSMCAIAYGCNNDIIFNSSKSQVMFFDTMKYGQMNLKNSMLGQKTLNVTKSYRPTYLGHIITDNLCDEADIYATEAQIIAAI